MIRSIRYLFFVLLSTMLFSNLSAQNCLNIEFVQLNDCNLTPLGGTANILITVTDADSSQGQWFLAEGNGGGPFNIPIEVTVPFGDFSNQLFITVIEANNQSCTGTLIIDNPCFDQCPLVIEAETIVGAPCDSLGLGSVDFFVDEVSPPFVIEIYDAFGNLLASQEGETFFDNLPPDNYSALLYDATDLCQESIPFTIPIDSDLEVEITGAPNSGGGILLTANVSGGAPPYEYIWNNGELGSSIVIFEPGIYFVEVMDSNDCQVFDNWVQEEEVCVSVEAAITDASCGQNDGAIDITVLPNSDGMSFLWSNGEETEDLENLSPGTYTLTINNGILCSQTISYFVGIDGPQVTVFTENEAGSVFNPCGPQPGPAIVFIEYPDGQSTGSEEVIWVDVESGDTVAVDVDGFYPEDPGDYQVYVNFSENPECNYTETLTWTAPTFEIVQDLLIDSIPCFGAFYAFELNGNFVPAEVTLPNGTTIIVQQFLDVAQYGPGLYVASPMEGICDEQDELVDSLLVLPEEVECVSIFGQVYVDANNDCALQADEELIPQRLIRISSTTNDNEFYAFSDLDGAWDATLPFDTYEIEVVLENTLFQNCQPPTVVTVSDSGPFASIDLGIQPTGDICPQLTVNVTVPLMRRCFFSNIWVSYDNTGTQTAEDAQIIVELGDWVDEIQQNPFSMPYDSIVAGDQPGDPSLVYFNIGDVPPFGSGSVSLRVRTCNDDIPLGAAVCVRAIGLPNNPCPPADDAWGGASLRVDGRCTDDGQVSFRIRNVGLPLVGNLSYTITEDAVMLREESVPGDELDDAPYLDEFDATGATYHILVDQAPNHPGLTMPTTFVEGCVGGSSQQPSYGFALQIPPNSDAYWVDEDCLEVIGAYDPNDKLAEPRGYGNDNFIEPGTPVEYTIRFQNTGTDTAFNVFIRDTLHPLLDPGTITLGAASHRYRADIDTAGAINFFFDNIMLPDSFVNEPASHGAVSFTILPYEDIEPGNAFTNRAGIYFDFNDPIITNDYLLTIEEDFLSTSIFEWSPRATELVVFPNPTQGPAWIELPQAALDQELEIVVIDLLGREQLQYSYGPATERPGVDLANLVQGWYVLQLRSSGQLLGTGRVLLE
ncbi:MAG: T9SS type A sorting domain-containing protein [Bacteroidota bacterium]